MLFNNNCKYFIFLWKPHIYRKTLQETKWKQRELEKLEKYTGFITVKVIVSIVMLNCIRQWAEIMWDGS